MGPVRLPSRKEAATSESSHGEQPGAKQAQSAGLRNRAGSRCGARETSWRITAEIASNMDIAKRYASRSIGIAEDEKQRTGGSATGRDKADRFRPDTTACT